MGSSALRQIVSLPASVPVAVPGPGFAPARPTRLGAILLGSGAITAVSLAEALAHQTTCPMPLGEILTTRGALSAQDLVAALAQQFGCASVDPGEWQPDVRLIDDLGAGFCLTHGVLPLRRMGSVTLVASARPERFEMLRPVAEQRLGPVAMAVCTEPALREALLTLRKRHLARASESRVAPQDSCRDLSAHRVRRTTMLLAGALGLAGLLAPGFLFAGLTWFALVVLTLNTGFAAVLALAHIAALRRAPQSGDPVLTPLRPVRVSILVALFHERRIAEHLVARLDQIDYPADLLDILLVTEEDDTVTRDTLAALTLPPTMRCITVPRGQVQTKPRALNYALDFCRGSIVGVYDAEDAPDPGQITAVVRQFQHSAPQVACLQGRLDYYNPRDTWMARCFTIEYAAWFRVLLPGLAHLGLVVPLGGTTLFFRKAALVALGGWDAHNVTEDADLGLRLARRGYRCDLVDTVTREEANCRPWPWVRQRSRWIKGYAMTYLVHMRAPRVLWRDLGTRGFLGVQVLFLGSLLGSFTAPLLWVLWALPLGLSRVWPQAPDGPLLVAVLLGATAVHWAIWSLGTWQRGDRTLLGWVPTLTLYHMLASVAAAKAAIEVVTRPFFWDKTSHGHTPLHSQYPGGAVGVSGAPETPGLLPPP